MQVCSASGQPSASARAGGHQSESARAQVDQSLGARVRVPVVGASDSERPSVTTACASDCAGALLVYLLRCMECA